ncbi:MAG TPA: lipopolysaccharide transport periplasmic protein LptA, partial [Gammaproteobacteria bacterium]|nr:lipopolysaccharide transport periplasmic protein LptA [Gammaproteobacteria bacterium]
RVLLLLCGLGVAASAWALKSDKNQPINIQADHGDFKSTGNDNNNGTGIYTGHVVITQGSILLTADKAVVHIVNGELSTADVTGQPATFQQQPDTGELMHGLASEITYDESNNMVDLIDNARLNQGVRLMIADHIRYNTETEHVIAKSSGDGDRVRMVIPPKQNPPVPSTAWPPVSATAPPAATAKRPAAAATTQTAPAPATGAGGSQ